MKKIIILLIMTLIFFSCGKEEPLKLETFSTEAFAYDIGDSWEVNATTRVKGFSQTGEENNYSATVACDIDLVTPGGDTLKAMISKVIDKTDDEKIADFPVEVQFELDSTYSAGEYMIIFNLKDAATSQSTTTSSTFSLVSE